MFHRQRPGEDDVCCWMHHLRAEDIGGWFSGVSGGEETREAAKAEDIQKRSSIAHGIEGTAKNAVKI